MSRQLALGLTLQPAFSFDSFIPGPNGEALDAVRRLAAGAGEPYLYLWGPAGVGKSHLLQAAAQQGHQVARGPLAVGRLLQRQQERQQNVGCAVQMQRVNQMIEIQTLAKRGFQK